MDKLTKEQAIAIMGFTGITTINFGEFHRDVEKRLGHPVFTHEFVGMGEQMKELYKEDFLSICPFEQ